MRDEDAWLALERPPFIYLGGITLRPGVDAAKMAGAPGPVYDSWDDVDLEELGFARERIEEWFLRPPLPPPPGNDPPELDIVRAGTAEAAEFEAVSVRGFGGEESTVEVGSIHPPIENAQMVLWLARVDGAAVCAAMTYRTDRALGIFGVTTVESARGRGYATALLRRALADGSGVPAVLNTDSEAAGRVYKRLGFRRVGSCPLWKSTSSVSPDQ